MDPTIISNSLNIYIHKITNKMVNHRINISDQYIYTLRSIKKRPLMCYHDIRAKKLEIYGFNKKTLALFNSHMTNRTQQVQIGNALYDKCPVKFGVPQTQHLAHYCLFYI